MSVNVSLKEYQTWFNMTVSVYFENRLGKKHLSQHIICENTGFH